MVNRKLKVVIDNEAKQSLWEAYRYIKKDSLQNAHKVRAKILATIKALPKNSQRHNPDKYRIKNEDGLYRAYEVYKYRITYHVSQTEVRVLRIRHTKMNPLKY